MHINNVKTTTQKSTESWNKRKNVLIERLLNKSAEIRRIHTPITQKKEEAKLDRALIRFAKIKAELDTYHWQANKRTDTCHCEYRQQLNTGRSSNAVYPDVDVKFISI